MIEDKKKKLWVVSEVEDEAKDKAKILAKASGKNIGPWLSEFILDNESTNKKNVDQQAEAQIIKTLLMKHDQTLEAIKELGSLVLANSFRKKSFLDKFFR